MNWKINSEGLIVLNSALSFNEDFENLKFEYKLVYHDWTGYLTIYFDSCSLGDIK